MAGHGGYRPGSGRKRNPLRTSRIAQNIIKRKLEDPSGEYETPLDFLIAVMQDKEQPIELRVDCAKSAAPYVHAKLQSIDITTDEQRKMVIEFVDYSKPRVVVQDKSVVQQVLPSIIEQDENISDISDSFRTPVTTTTT